MKTKTITRLPDFTDKAKTAILKAHESARRLRADLQALNVAITVEGNNSAAERLAHNALLDILTKFASARDAINLLGDAMREAR
jgi:hypothetical protein